MDFFISKHTSLTQEFGILNLWAPMKLIKQAYLISYTIKRDNLLGSDATSNPMKLDKTGQAFYWYSL